MIHFVFYILLLKLYKSKSDEDLISHSEIALLNKSEEWYKIKKILNNCC
jgi:hypothetical protein